MIKRKNRYWMTALEAAAVTHLHRSTIINMIYRGEIRAQQPRGKNTCWYIDPESIADLLQQQGAAAAQEIRKSSNIAAGVVLPIRPSRPDDPAR